MTAQTPQGKPMNNPSVLVERVRGAIFGRQPPKSEFENNYQLNVARAAMAEIREIDVDLINRCTVEPSEHAVKWFKAYIDAALTESK